MVACRSGYPHPKDYKWSSYHYHYDYMATAPRLVPNSVDVTRANKIFDLINCSKSAQTNKCPLLRSGFSWPTIQLTDILEVNTFDLDRLYTKHEFKIIVHKCVISAQTEYESEKAHSIKDYLQRTKKTLHSLSELLGTILNGKTYQELTKEEKEEVIMKIFSCTNATQMQIVMLLDEDKEHIKNLYLKHRYKKISW